MPGYKVVRKITGASGIAHLEYLEVSRQSFGPEGFTWAKKKKAQEALRFYQLEHVGQEESLISMSVVSADEAAESGDVSADEQAGEPNAVPVVSKKVAGHPREFSDLMQSARLWSDMMAKTELYSSIFSDQLSEEDQRAQDILHFIELNDLSDEESVSIVKYLTESRRCRRQAKEALEVLNVLAPAMFVAQKTAHMLERMPRRVYTPRVEADMREAIHQDFDSKTEEASPEHAESEPATPVISESEKVPQEEKGNTITATEETDREIVAQMIDFGVSMADKRALHIYADYLEGAKRRDLQKAYGVSKSTVQRDIARGELLIRQERNRRLIVGRR